jgi:hypothetical protein
LKKILLNINNKHFSDIQKIKDNVCNNNKKIKNIFSEKKLEIQKLKNEIKSLNNVIINNNIQNKNSSIKASKHISDNNCKNIVKSYYEIMSPKIWNTLPTDISETNIGNTSREITYKDSYIQTSRISNTKSIKGKKIFNKIKKYNTNTNINYNKSLEFHNSIETDIHKSQHLLPFENKINLKNKKKKNNFSYKKDIYNLQNEFNNILFKSITHNQDTFNLINDKNKTPKINPIYIKKDNYTYNRQKKENEIKEIFSHRGMKNKMNIQNFSSNNMNTQTSQILQRNEKEYFNRYKNVSVTDNNNNNNTYYEIRKKKNNIYNIDFFADFFLKINNNVFGVFEFTNYKQKYDSQNIENVYLSFKKICNELKNKTDETNLKINNSYYLTNKNFKDYNSSKNERREFIDNSFKIFNERIISLKKFEFEFINMSEYIKNYLVSLEITIKIMYSKDKKYLKFEPIEKLFNLFEDCLSYRIDEMNENIIFNRKLLIQLFKNQINCLFLSFEYKFN